MFKDEEILNALSRIQKQLDTLQYELRCEKIDRMMAQEQGQKNQKLQEQIIEKMGQQAKRPAWPLMPGLGIWPHKPFEEMTNLEKHTTTGYRAMTPQQAAGVPDDVPDSLIEVYKYAHSLRAKDLSDIVDKLNKEYKPAKRPCGCLVSLPKDYHFPSCSTRDAELGRAKNWQQRVGHCTCSPLPNYGCPLHGSYLRELKALIQKEVAQVYEEMKICKECSSTFCKAHAYGSLGRVASDRVMNSPRGKELKPILDAIGKPDQGPIIPCTCPDNCLIHRGKNNG